MKMPSLDDGSRVNAVHVVGVDGAHSCVVPTRSHESGQVEDTNEVTHDIDDGKTPLVFGRLWREVISVFTLACAPGLNVLSLQGFI